MYKYIDILFPLVYNDLQFDYNQHNELGLSMKTVLSHICDMCDHKIVYLDYTKTVFLMVMSSTYGQNQRLYLPPNLVEIIFHILDNFR